ncbi:MAG: hypothetical protein QXW78_01955 [Candidatus Thermoplasmatota archaeon]
MEWLINRAALGLIPSKIKQDFANPITASLVNHPEKVGQTAWLFYNESEG